MTEWTPELKKDVCAVADFVERTMDNLHDPKKGVKATILRNYFGAAVHYPLFRRISKATGIKFEGGNKGLGELAFFVHQNGDIELARRLAKMADIDARLQGSYKDSIRNGGESGTRAFYKLAKKPNVWVWQGR